MTTPPPIRKIETRNVPQLICIDLDDTLWHPELYLSSGAPFTLKSDGKVYASGGEEMQYLGDSRAILQELDSNELFIASKVVYVSRTRFPHWAAELLPLMQVDNGRTMKDVGEDELNQIYPGDKQAHFKKIKELSSVSYEKMLFFDNEIRNIVSVGKLGVTCIHTPDGLTRQKWEHGLSVFAKNMQEYQKK